MANRLFWLERSSHWLQKQRGLRSKYVLNKHSEAPPTPSGVLICQTLLDS